MFIQLIVALIVFGVLLYLVNNFLPMDEKIKQLVNILAIVIALLWVLQAFGLLAGFRLG